LSDSKQSNDNFELKDNVSKIFSKD